MSWKRLRLVLLIVLALVIVLPAIFYLLTIDLSYGYTKEVEQLQLYEGQQNDGLYRLAIEEFEIKMRTAGLDNQGDNVILLHGFPQSSITWRPLLEKGSAQGYRLIAFDQRGYSPGARPKGKENYQIDLLVQDVLDVANAMGFDTFHLVGHDWGSGVGWKTVMEHPERIKTWTGMSIPHIATFFDAFMNHPEQQKRSSYIGLIRWPVIPELLLSLRRDQLFSAIENVWTDEQVEEASALFGEHGALTAAMNWYRALDYEDQEVISSLQKKVIRPTLFIWGKHDPVVAPEIVPAHKDWINAPYTELALDAGHSLMQEKTMEVLDAILDHWHLSSGSN